MRLTKTTEYESIGVSQRFNEKQYQAIEMILLSDSHLGTVHKSNTLNTKKM